MSDEKKPAAMDFVVYLKIGNSIQIIISIFFLILFLLFDETNKVNSLFASTYYLIDYLLLLLSNYVRKSFELLELCIMTHNSFLKNTDNAIFCSVNLTACFFIGARVHGLLRVLLDWIFIYFSFFLEIKYYEWRFFNCF